jgi:hypothetical protein
MHGALAAAALSFVRLAEGPGVMLSRKRGWVAAAVSSFVRLAAGPGVKLLRGRGMVSKSKALRDVVVEVRLRRAYMND